MEDLSQRYQEFVRIYHDFFIEKPHAELAVLLALEMADKQIRCDLQEEADKHKEAELKARERANLMADVLIADLTGRHEALLRALADQPEIIRRQMARNGAEANLKKDPRQREKAFIRECWQDWQEGARSYKGKAAFARDMLAKCEHLTSSKKIEDWCREWSKEPPTQPAG